MGVSPLQLSHTHAHAQHAHAHAHAAPQLAVCVIELWPEARACKHDRSLAAGITAGIVVMGWTLSVETG